MTTETELCQLLDVIQNLKKAKATIDEAYDLKIGQHTMKLETLMEGSGIAEIKTELAHAGYRNNTNVEVKDWNAVMEYVAKNNAFDCIQKRIAPAQLKKRIDDGAVITGVTIKESKTFVITGAREK